MTALYIDEGCELNKKILSVGLIGDHKGGTIWKALEKCIKEWGITKICTVTIDNDFANQTTLAYLKRNYDCLEHILLIGWGLHACKVLCSHMEFDCL